MNVKATIAILVVSCAGLLALTLHQVHLVHKDYLEGYDKGMQLGYNEGVRRSAQAVNRAFKPADDWYRGASCNGQDIFTWVQYPTGDQEEWIPLNKIFRVIPREGYKGEGRHSDPNKYYSLSIRGAWMTEMENTIPRKKDGHKDWDKIEEFLDLCK